MLRLVIGEGLTVAAVGVVVGAAGSLATARWLSTLVYGVSSRDPLSYGIALLLLLPTAALAGCWRPARRAAAANPAATIRDE